MLRPSYTELMDILNTDSKLDDRITSNYAIVIAAAKRARQLIDGELPLAVAPTDKVVSIAISEIQKGLVSVVPDNAKASRPYTDEAGMESEYMNFDYESYDIEEPEPADEEEPGGDYEQ